MTTFSRIFQKLKYFDTLADEPQYYAILKDLVEDYLKNTQVLTDNERIFFAYILSERAFNQGYAMGYSKEYEMNDMISYFFKMAFEIGQIALRSDDVRYIEYKKMLE